MVEKARVNGVLAGCTNVELHEADMAQLPLDTACEDVVISNGAINLSPWKACVLKEAFCVLKPGGRFYIADMVRDAAEPHPTPNTAEPPGSSANCVAGI